MLRLYSGVCTVYAKPIDCLSLLCLVLINFVGLLLFMMVILISERVLRNECSSPGDFLYGLVCWISRAGYQTALKPGPHIGCCCFHCYCALESSGCHELTSNYLPTWLFFHFRNRLWDPQAYPYFSNRHVGTGTGHYKHQLWDGTGICPVYCKFAQWLDFCKMESLLPAPASGFLISFSGEAGGVMSLAPLCSPIGCLGVIPAFSPLASKCPLGDAFQGTAAHITHGYRNNNDASRGSSHEPFYNLWKRILVVCALMPQTPSLRCSS